MNDTDPASPEPTKPDSTPEPDGGSTHYFDPDPDSASEPLEVTMALPDLTVKLTSDRGVFSGRVVDMGTKLLLNEAPHPPPGDLSIVDVGCGYGPIAIAMAMRAPMASVLAVDINARARALCATNAEQLNLTNVRVTAPDEVATDLVVDRIYSNPPIRIGKAALHQLLDGWLRRLHPDGAAYLVVQKHLGADSLAKRYLALGFNVTRISARRSYRVLEIKPSSDAAPTAAASTSDAGAQARESGLDSTQPGENTR